MDVSKFRQSGSKIYKVLTEDREGLDRSSLKEFDEPDDHVQSLMITQSLTIAKGLRTVWRTQYLCREFDSDWN